MVIGAAGGIGGALCAALAEAGFARVVGLSRRPAALPDGVEAGRIDIEDEASVARAAASLGEAPALRLAIVATGLLSGGGIAPEKRLAALDPAAMARSYSVNAIGPALCAKHLLPRLARDGRAVFACLSARVGSIADNRAGGWHAYRASKAALNMIVRNLAIEAAHRTPGVVCLALHPGTVATGLSAPFSRNIPDGQAVEPAVAARRLLRVIDAAGPARSGRCLAWDGSEVSP